MLTFGCRGRGRNLQRVAQFLERLVDQFDVAAVGLVAQQLQGVGDDFADQVAVVDPLQFRDQMGRKAVDFGELLS